MKVAATFIKHNVMTILLYLMVIVFGFYSFSTLPLALMPSMEIPAAIVYATYPGAGPEDIEQQVTKPVWTRSSPPPPRICPWSSFSSPTPPISTTR